MLETNLDAAPVDETATTVTDDHERSDEKLGDEDLADEVIVEISVDGMCGVY
jgi:mycofactocin precursor